MIDAGILEEVLGSIHNFFIRGTIGVSGCSIEGATLPASVSIPNGAWYRIRGSVLNDGMHLHPAYDLNDETFDGEIDVCAVPTPLLSIVEEIQDYNEAARAATAKVAASPYQSESFGGYSYTLKQSSASASSASAGAVGWQAEFLPRLRQWRKLA